MKNSKALSVKQCALKKPDITPSSLHHGDRESHCFKGNDLDSYCDFFFCNVYLLSTGDFKNCS